MNTHSIRNLLVLVGVATASALLSGCNSPEMTIQAPGVASDTANLSIEISGKTGDNQCMLSAGQQTCLANTVAADDVISAAAGDPYHAELTVNNTGDTPIDAFARIESIIIDQATGQNVAKTHYWQPIGSVPAGEAKTVEIDGAFPTDVDPDLQGAVVAMVFESSDRSTVERHFADVG